MSMKLSQFKFNLPKELIAEYPSKNRDESKLMVVHRDTGEIEHKTFKDILTKTTFLFSMTLKFSLQDYLVSKKRPMLRLKFFFLEK